MTPRKSGWLGRLLRRGDRVTPLDPERTDLVVVVESFDDVESCSSVLERAAAGSPAWTPQAQAVLRHHLRLPLDAVEPVSALAAQDAYQARAGDPDDDGRVLVHLYRVQVLDALHCAQERSRMASLAQRHGGDALGWDALQPAPGEFGAG